MGSKLKLQGVIVSLIPDIEIGMIQYNGELGAKEVFFDFGDVNDRNILIEGIQVGFESDSKLENASKVWEITEMGAKESNYDMDGEIADDASDCRQNITDVARTKKSQRLQGNPRNIPDEAIPGEIKAVVDRKYGFIKRSDSGGDLFFLYSHVDKKDQSLIQNKAKVKCLYDEKSSPDKPRAKKVWILSCEKGKEKNMKTKPGSVVVGVVMEMKSHMFNVNTSEGIVKVYKDKLSPYILGLQNGDEVQFVKMENKRQDTAKQVKIKKYFGSSLFKHLNYFDHLDKNLDTCKSHQVIEDVCSNPAQWRCFGEINMNLSDNEFKNYFLRFLGVINSIVRKSRSFHKSSVRNMLEAVLTSNVFSQQSNQMYDIMESFDLDEESHVYEVFKYFTEAVAKHTPFFLGKLRWFLDGVCRGKLSENKAKLLLLNWRLLAKHETGSSVDDKWCDMPTMITNEELVGKFLHQDINLSPVKVTEGYKNEDEYMDTYMRLLRAECFSSIQKGIHDLKSGELDSRDMNVYTEVALVGHSVSHSSFTIGVTFKPEKEVKDWNKTQQLMYGNLVCLSAKKDFSDPIWATVEERNIDLLNKDKIINLQFCDFNSMTLGAMITRLQSFSGCIWMVESPTYFNSLKPVLEAFQNFSMESFALKSELVYGKKAKIGKFRRPAYLNKGVVEAINKHMPSLIAGLEESQVDAFIHALTNKVAIIQGPPGTGKTFLGTKIVEILLKNPYLAVESDLTDGDGDPLNVCTYAGTIDMFNSEKKFGFIEQTIDPEIPSRMFFHLNQVDSRDKLLVRKDANVVFTFDDTEETDKPSAKKVWIERETIEAEKIGNFLGSIPTPILLLTYKNHALDEFLLKMVELLGSEEVVRIGGRSKEPRLDECNLSKLRLPNPKGRYAEIAAIRSNIEDLKEELKECMNNLHSATIIDKVSLVKLLNEKQVEHLLKDEKWNKKNKDWLQGVLDMINTEGKSVKDLLLTKLGIVHNSINIPDKFSDYLVKMWEAVVKKWIPAIEKIRQLRDLNQKFMKIKAKRKYQDEDDFSYEVEEISDTDEDYIREMEEKRISANLSKQQNDKKTELTFIKKTSGDVFCQLSDFPADLEIEENIANFSELWLLEETERIKLLDTLLKIATKDQHDELEQLFDTLNSKHREKRNLENQIKVDICKRKKIVGMTITGASINSDIIQRLAPKIVIVEEAAEILEPSLLAAFNEDMEHLILIGDHKQLKPNVETYELRKKFNFNISMMERLIMSRMEFKMLKQQCRMRPEFSSMLKDIYPRLRDNMEIVLNENHNQHYCINTPMYFWSHNLQEKKTRSYKNPDEAKMVVSLAVYLLVNGVKINQITLLAAYLGRTKVLRDELKEAKRKHPKLMEEMIQVSTIDMFQGDENDFVIISLVRSNSNGGKNPIGFMHEMNRRCVAQSRARRGMFFIGDADTYASSSTWRPLVSHMMKENCCGSVLPIQCQIHRDGMKHLISSAVYLNKFNNLPGLICQLPCREFMSCKIHKCKQKCMPLHNHTNCKENVQDNFARCGHDVIRVCSESILNLKCEAKIDFLFRCRHPGSRKCFVDETTLRCKRKCEKLMDCRKHYCEEICGKLHSHIQCRARVEFHIQECRHLAERECWEDPKSVICKTKTPKKLLCGHIALLECHKPLPNTCSEMIQYNFPKCQHPSPKRKKCSETIAWLCLYEVDHRCPKCRRTSKRECSKDHYCKLPCPLRRGCGHQCQNMCAEDCEKGSCKVCKKIEEEKMRKFRDVANRKIKELQEEVSKRNCVKGRVLSEIKRGGDTLAEFQKVEDLVQKFIQPMHNWSPTVKQIQRVRNMELEEKFEKAKLKSFGDFIDDKFHGTDNAGVEGITTNGFRLPQAAGMYGAGVYFATDSSKSAQEIYTKGSKKLLLCKVLLGKSFNLKKSDKTMNLQKLRQKGYDSIYAPRHTAVQNDEYVVFDPDQALPMYIIHYEYNKVPALQATPSLSTNKQKMIKICVKPSRNQDPTDARQANFMKVEAIFYRLQNIHRQCSGGYNPKEIKSVDFILYPDTDPIKAKFDAKKKTFAAQNFTEEIYAFHGTSSQNVDSILKTNLDPRRAPAHGLVYGSGCYFSEFPNFSLNYGDGLILFRVLPGKEYLDETSDSNWAAKGYHSKKVRATADRYAEQIIIQDSGQFLPFCVYHF